MVGFRVCGFASVRSDGVRVSGHLELLSFSNERLAKRMLISWFKGWG